MADACKSIKDLVDAAIKLGTGVEAAKTACKASVANLAKGACEADICSSATVQVVNIYIFRV